jgi:addiction module HigA family antidote
MPAVRTIRVGGVPTPGDALRAEFLRPLGLSVAALAEALGVPSSRVRRVLAGGRVDAPLALLLGRCLDTPARYWLNLQSGVDLALAEARMGPELAAVVPVRRPRENDAADA